MLDFFFADNATTPVVSFDTAYEAQNYLLEFMFRKDFPANPQAPYLLPFSSWPTYAQGQTAANITVKGFEFGPQDEALAARCAFINELIMDPANGV